jgi:hypothetical protein
MGTTTKLDDILYEIKTTNIKSIRMLKLIKELQKRLNNEKGAQG